MTTAAYDGETVAADTSSFFSDQRIPFPVIKIHFYKKGKRKFIVSGAGTPQGVMTLFRHFVNKTSKGNYNSRELPILDTNIDSSALVIELFARHKHRAFIVSATGTFVEFTGQPTAVGSGETYAVGALYMNASAAEAVAAAHTYDVYTGPEVYEVNIQGEYEYKELEDYDAEAEQE